MSQDNNVTLPYYVREALERASEAIQRVLIQRAPNQLLEQLDIRIERVLQIDKSQNDDQVVPEQPQNGLRSLPE